MIEGAIMTIVFWIGFAIAVSAWANSLGRNAFGWLCLALVISPLLAGIMLAAVGRYGKTCPKCAEKVRREAAVCKHCGHEFADVDRKVAPASNLVAQGKAGPWKEGPKTSREGYAPPHIVIGLVIIGLIAGAVYLASLDGGDSTYRQHTFSRADDETCRQLVLIARANGNDSSKEKICEAYRVMKSGGD